MDGEPFQILIRGLNDPPNGSMPYNSYEVKFIYARRASARKRGAGWLLLGVAPRADLHDEHAPPER